MVPPRVRQWRPNRAPVCNNFASSPRSLSPQAKNVALIDRHSMPAHAACGRGDPSGQNAAAAPLDTRVVCPTGIAIDKQETRSRRRTSHDDPSVPAWSTRHEIRFIRRRVRPNVVVLPTTRPMLDGPREDCQTIAGTGSVRSWWALRLSCGFQTGMTVGTAQLVNICLMGDRVIKGAVLRKRAVFTRHAESASSSAVAQPRRVFLRPVPILRERGFT